MTKAAWRTGAALALWLAVSPVEAGGLSFFHPVAPPTPQCAEPCKAIPQEWRDRVHIFLINGVDPLYFGNLVGVRSYLQQLGFTQTEYGELFHWWRFKNQVRQVRRDDPQADIVLIGFSLGGSMADSLARNVQREGVWIDLLVYVDAKSFTHNFHHLPENVGRVVNVTSLGQLWDGSVLTGAENIHEDHVWHFGSPTHPRTLDAIAANLAALAPPRGAATGAALKTDEANPVHLTSMHSALQLETGSGKTQSNP